MALALSAVLSLQVLVWRTPQLVGRAAAGRGARAGRLLATGDDDSDGWEVVDQWLQGEGKAASVATAPASREPDEAPRPLSPSGGSLLQTSAGHLHDHFFSLSARDFTALGASARVVANLNASGFHRPSCAQADGFGSILRGDSLLLAQPSGSGKTLAFLAPIIDLLFRWEERDGPVGKGEVRALILVSSPELAQQALSLARALAGRKLKCSAATGAHNYATQRERIVSGLDLLVGTLGRVCGHVAPRGGKPTAFTARLRALVLDDFDSLYFNGGSGVQSPDDFRLLLHTLVGPSTQLALAASVLRPSVLHAIHADLLTASVTPTQDGATEHDAPTQPPGGRRLVEVRGRGLHVTRPGVEQTLVCIGPVESAQSSFASRLAATILCIRSAAPSSHTLVVTNTPATCNRLAAQLARADPPVSVGEAAAVVLCAHERMEAGVRGAAMARFVAQGERPRVLVATARLLRGLNVGDGQAAEGEHAARGEGGGVVRGGGEEAADASGGEGQGVGRRAARVVRSVVQHIVLFDFPPNGPAYVHRLGLATRGDEPPARVTLLATDRQMDFARRMMAHDVAGQPVGLES